MLRKQGIKTQETRLGRETSAGRIAVYADVDKGVGAMVELMCESAPVASSAEFRQFANDLAKQLATGPGAATADELLAQPSPSKPGQTLGQAERRHVQPHARSVQSRPHRAVRRPVAAAMPITTARSARWSKSSGGNDEAAKDVAMHVAAQKPQVVTKEDLDPADIDQEREILSVAARKEGKPENIIAKMVEGRLRELLRRRVLLEQPFVKDDKQTVGQMAEEGRHDRSSGSCAGSWASSEGQRCRAVSECSGRGSRVRFRSRCSFAESSVAMAADRTISAPAYRRVVLKLSGESFCHAGERGISMDEVVHIARQTVQAAQRGVQIAIVIGGGNILRGAQFTRRQFQHPRSHGPLHGHAGHGDQRPGPARRAGIARLRNAAARPPFAWTAWPSPISAAAPAGIWKKAGS